jgi:hypothetical protein
VTGLGTWFLESSSLGLIASSLKRLALFVFVLRPRHGGGPEPQGGGAGEGTGTVLMWFRNPPIPIKFEFRKGPVFVIAGFGRYAGEARVPVWSKLTRQLFFDRRTLSQDIFSPDL